MPKERYLTEEEFVALLDELQERRRLRVLVAVFTGARSSELAGLRLEEPVNLQTGSVLLPAPTPPSRRAQRTPATARAQNSGPSRTLRSIRGTLARVFR
ncbi:MAG: hypothetical protein EXR73_10720 [Myxococcales bacterium]|nr:hypothetical protein [Myxococcales bacterium]